METSSKTIATLYKSRKNILELLKKQKYNVSDYENFSVNEVHAMCINKQLDMLLNSEEGKKSYVKYHLGKTLRRENINDYIDDLYHLENVLEKNDTLIIIIKMEPNSTLINMLSQIWEQDGIFIILFNIERLQYNILDHELVPSHIILNDEEIQTLKQKYNINDINQLPQISRYDPVSLAIGMKPSQVCKIERQSKTAITSDYFRICVQ
tara:strand:+ start:366 stop:992 length:627 start_codon:yes stop_codon:yes gene_type:complete